MDTQPFALTSEEIKEIASIPEIQQMWGAVNAKDMEDYVRYSYAVRFDFVSGCPGYCGDMIIIQGDALDGEIHPVRLVRNDQDKLVIVS